MRSRSLLRMRCAGLLPLLIVLTLPGLSQGQRRIADTSPRPGAGTLVPEVNLVGSVGDDAELQKLVEEWLGTGGVAHVTRRPELLTLADITHPGPAGSPPVRLWVVAPT